METLAAERRTMRGEDLAEAVGTTRAFLAQVMTPLVRGRWVASTPGPTGGYRLRTGVDPSVLEVIEAIEGPTESGACVLDADAACASVAPGSRLPCALHEPWMRAQRAMREELSRSPAVRPEGSGLVMGSQDGRKEIHDVA